MKQLLHNNKISVEINGKVYWVTPEQYEEMKKDLENNAECIDGNDCPIREKASFYIPDFLKNKHLING